MDFEIAGISLYIYHKLVFYLQFFGMGMGISLCVCKEKKACKQRLY